MVYKELQPVYNTLYTTDTKESNVPMGAKTPKGFWKDKNSVYWQKHSTKLWFRKEANSKNPKRRKYSTKT